MRRILIVEDDLGSQLVLRKQLRAIDPSFYIQCVETAEAAHRLLSESEADRVPFDIVISDVHLPGSTGITLQNVSKKRHPGAEFLMISSSAIEEWASITSQKNDWPIVLQKPVTFDALKCFLDLSPNVGRARRVHR